MNTRQLLLITITLLLVFSFTKNVQAQNSIDYQSWEKKSPYIKEGPFRVVTDSNYTISPNILVHRPSSNLKGPFPIMLFHQGGPGIVTPRSYDIFMRHLASYGYVVVVQAIAFPPNPLRDDMKLTLDWIERQVDEDVDGWGSYADISKVIVGGHSFGGVVASTFIVNQPERALGIVYFASSAAPEPLQSLGAFRGKVLMIGGTEDQIANPDGQNGTFDRFTDASCKTSLYIEGADHGAFGVYERDSPGSIGREKATESIRHFFVSFMEGSFKNNLKAVFYFFIPNLQPDTVADFTSSCNPFDSTFSDDILESVTVYPNPIIDTHLYVSTKDGFEYSYELRDATGKVRKSDRGVSGTTAIDATGLSRGMYYVIVGIDGEKKVIKLRKN